MLDQKCRSRFALEDIEILKHISNLLLACSRPAGEKVGEGPALLSYGRQQVTGESNNRLNKSVSLRSETTDVYRITINCNDIKKPNYTLIKNYFSKFNLVTSKHNSFLL